MARYEDDYGEDKHQLLAEARENPDPPDPFDDSDTFDMFEKELMATYAKLKSRPVHESEEANKAFVKHMDVVFYDALDHLCAMDREGAWRDIVEVAADVGIVPEDM